MVSFREILKRLADHQVEFIVIGGVAAAIQGSPMATLDVDVCTTFDDQNLARLIEALRDINPKQRMRPDRMPLPLEVERLRGVRNLYVLTDIGILDLLGEVPGIGRFEELTEKTEVVDVGGFSCRVLNLETLIQSKAFAARPKDVENVRHLEVIRKLRRDQPGLFGGPGSPG